MTNKILLLEEFFAPAEMSTLWSYTMDRQVDFIASEVIGAEDQARHDTDFRRSRVLFDIADIYPLVSDRVISVLPYVLGQLQLEPFEIRELELQITASNDSDWFKAHHDSGHGVVSSRQLTFVYYCHREPRPFTGGQLRMYGDVDDASDPEAQRTALTITPVQNSIVFFPSHYLHEVLPTECASHQFADSRLTYNGWFHR